MRAPLPSPCLRCPAESHTFLSRQQTRRVNLRVSWGPSVCPHGRCTRLFSVARAIGNALSESSTRHATSARPEGERRREQRSRAVSFSSVQGAPCSGLLAASCDFLRWEMFELMSLMLYLFGSSRAVADAVSHGQVCRGAAGAAKTAWIAMHERDDATFLTKLSRRSDSQRYIARDRMHRRKNKCDASVMPMRAAGFCEKISVLRVGSSWPPPLDTLQSFALGGRLTSA